VYGAAIFFLLMNYKVSYMKTSILITGSILFLTFFCQAQIVNDFNTATVALNDGTKVTLYGKAHGIGDRSREEVSESGILNEIPGAKDGEYFYLPTGLKLSQNTNGIPQFLLLKYMTDEQTPDRDMSGALLHFLMEWGLTDDQRRECEQKLRRLRPGESNLKVVGPLRLEAPPGESFAITSAIASDAGMMNRTIITSGKAPVIEGGKIAVAANFNRYGAQLLGATLEKDNNKTSITDLSLTLSFQYVTQLPAMKGRVIFDWEKYAKNVFSDTTEQTVEKRRAVWMPFFFTTWTEGENVLDQRQQLYDSLSSSGVITLELEENYADESLSRIRDAILDMFMQSIATMIESYARQESEDPDARFDAEARVAQLSAVEYQQQYMENRKNRDFRAYMNSVREVSRKGRQVIELNYALAIKRDISLTENLLSWYDDVKRYNEACISKVILNDPFFQRLRIQFILDKDMIDIFDQEVNYATVNIRKKRNQGNDFTARVTLDKNYVRENGTQAFVTYAAGNDRNPDMYEYQVQYSFRGGQIYPTNPQWQRGTMEAVTLYPPIKMYTVEFESDLNRMNEYDIARSTMQIRYRRLGEEYQANIPVSPSRGQSLAFRTIFMDADMRGFAYRIVYDHKSEGKLATEWEARLGAIDYLYAPIPEAFRDKNSEVFKHAKQLGQVLTPTESREGKVVDKVLDIFKELFN